MPSTPLTPARALAPALTATLLLAGCGGEAAAPREGTSVEELTGDVSGVIDVDTARVGSRISLTGTVTKVLSPGAFEISAQDAASDRPLLVLNREDRLQPGQVVQVVGLVRVFVDDEQAAEYGLGATAQYPQHDRKRIVVADEVDTDVPDDGT
jgi:hypothetical protein